LGRSTLGKSDRGGVIANDRALHQTLLSFIAHRRRLAAIAVQETRGSIVRDVLENENCIANGIDGHGSQIARELKLYRDFVAGVRVHNVIQLLGRDTIRVGSRGYRVRGRG